MARCELERLQKTNYRAWGEHVLWLRNEDSYRAERLEAERQARIAAAKPKPKAAPAAVDRGATLVTVRGLETFAQAVGELIHEESQKQTRESSGRFASAERVAELQRRVGELESRLAGFEKRVAASDSAVASHRRHLSNLETKYNDLRREVRGESPSGEKIERSVRIEGGAE